MVPKKSVSKAVHLLQVVNSILFSLPGPGKLYTGADSHFTTGMKQA